MFRLFKNGHIAKQMGYHYIILKKQGIEYIYEEHSGGHTWEYWDGHLPEVLDWLQDTGKYAKAPELAEEV